MAVRILEGDALQVLRTLPDQSVQCCVTSPPYFGLRDYGTAQWDGGESDCDHSPEKRAGYHFASPVSGSASSRDCPCGAIQIDRQLGLEKTPELYVEAMVGVFREVRRVLRDDATLWLNIGDSYAGSWGNYGGQNRGKGTQRPITKGSAAPNPAYDGLEKYLPATANVAGCKAKDLIGIPWLLAFALRADGWYLRSDIIWHKPNPMPESVTDRPTKSHEYLFLLSKNERYFYDADAISEPLTESSVERLSQPGIELQIGSERVPGKTNGNMKAVGKLTTRSTISGGRHSSPQLSGRGDLYSASGRRNSRSVWTVATQPFSEAHFATFPPKLIEPCILAGSAKQACEKCGAPWGREVERTAMVIDRSERTHDKGHTRSSGTMLEPPTSKTLGFKPTCDCENSGTGKSLVLDPFGGAGTTGLVADRLGRDALLIELNPKYAEMARNRIHSDNPLFGDVA